MSIQAPRTAERAPGGGWWREASRWERFRTVALVVLVAGHAALQLLYLHWYLEDAAISFSFARHLADGEGLVAYPGGERVEGYSNPLWVFLIAGWELFGVTGFTSSKLMGAGFGAGAVYLVWAITRLIRGADDHVPLVAALMLAVNPQFVIWSASGLENPLFCFLMALGVHRTLVEERDGGWPWSALAWFGLAITRPEGVLYAAAAGFWTMVSTLHAKRGIQPTLRWLLTFFLPFGAYHAARYLYFAWPFPNTYYAKVENRDYNPWSWRFKGWRYLGGWAEELWQAFALPVYAAGVVGLRDRRALLGALPFFVAVAALMLPGSPVDGPAPQWWDPLRIWLLIGAAVALPLPAIGRPGWTGRVLCWSLAAVGVAFSVRAGGDWARGYRWFSLIPVPLSVLFGLGVGEAVDALRGLLLRLAKPAARWPGRVSWLALALAVVPVIPDVAYLDFYVRRPETSPAKIKARVTYMRYVERRLHMDRVVTFDVDMGGIMYWSGHEIVDIAGLVDVPMAHHDYEKAFIREYIFEERRPDFAHLHAGWEKKVGVRAMPEYPKTYLELPPYPTGRTGLHPGNRIRRDLLVSSVWDGPEGRVVLFEDGITLEGFDVPAADAAPGRDLYVELAFRSRQRVEREDFRVVVFLAGQGRVATFSVAPGYDWYLPHEWRPDEVVFGGYSLPLPADLPPGSYDFGVVVLGPDGVIPATSVDVDPVVAAGEVRWPSVVRVVPKTDEAARVASARASLAEQARVGRCEAAEESWESLRLRRYRDQAWHDRNRPDVVREISSCWLARALTASTPQARVEPLARARWWDHHTPGLHAAADPVADALMAEGLLARDTQDWETAYRRFSDALRVDATRSFARKYAEEARTFRLGIDPVSKERAAAEREERRRDRAERRDRIMPPPLVETPRLIEWDSGATP